jgi:hypothetical protein
MITAEQYRFIPAPTSVVWMSHDPTAMLKKRQQIAADADDSGCALRHDE